MSEPAVNARVVLADVEIGGAVRVTLDVQGREYVGEVEVTDDGVEATAARATLAALDVLTPAAVSFELNRVHVSGPEGDLGVGLLEVVVTLTVAGAPMHYVGAALVRDDLPSTAARAVLHALNRRLGIMEIV